MLWIKLAWIMTLVVAFVNVLDWQDDFLRHEHAQRRATASAVLVFWMWGTAIALWLLKAGE